MDCLACSVLKECMRPWPANFQTFMFPSAEPVTKTSSEESMASALMAESCAWNVWSSCLWRMSKIQTNPFRPPVMISCCLGAYWRTVAPFSWHWNACIIELLGETRVSHKQTFLPSLDCPAVAIRLEDVMKEKSQQLLLWHCQLKYGLGFEEVWLTCQRLKKPSPSATPHLLPCELKYRRVTRAFPACLKQMSCCGRFHSNILTLPSWAPVI